MGRELVDLPELYDGLGPALAEAFPDNDHRNAKLRQVLQQLRERGEVEFVEWTDGTYRLHDLDTEQTGSRGGGTADAGVGEPEPTPGAAREYETTTVARSVSPGFRDAVLERYGARCPVSGVAHGGLLEVAHVLSWNEHPDRRADLGNLLPLAATQHAAFDAGLFTLDGDMRLRVHPDFEAASDALALTLHDRVGDRVLDPEAPLSPACLSERNRGLAWY